jgi:hypothetical protein
MTSTLEINHKWPSEDMEWERVALEKAESGDPHCAIAMAIMFLARSISGKQDYPLTHVLAAGEGYEVSNCEALTRASYALESIAESMQGGKKKKAA